MKQLVVEKNNPDPILWDTPIPQPGPGEVLIKNHYSVVSSGTEMSTIESANVSIGEKLQDETYINKGLALMKKEGVAAVWNAVFPKNLLPTKLGYSSCREVIEVGEGVNRRNVDTEEHHDEEERSIRAQLEKLEEEIASLTSQ